jgi:hypothetical protein
VHPDVGITYRVQGLGGNLLSYLLSISSGADGTTCLDSLLKEISVIVSMVWQAMTLLRSQHLGLGRGGVWTVSQWRSRTFRKERNFGLRRVGMVTSS